MLCVSCWGGHSSQEMILSISEPPNCVIEWVSIFFLSLTLFFPVSAAPTETAIAAEMGTFRGSPIADFSPAAWLCSQRQGKDSPSDSGPQLLTRAVLAYCGPYLPVTANFRKQHLIIKSSC